MSPGRSFFSRPPQKKTMPPSSFASISAITSFYAAFEITTSCLRISVTTATPTMIDRRTSLFWTTRELWIPGLCPLDNDNAFLHTPHVSVYLSRKPWRDHSGIVPNLCLRLPRIQRGIVYRWPTKTAPSNIGVDLTRLSSSTVKNVLSSTRPLVTTHTRIHTIGG